MSWQTIKLSDISANIQTGPFGSQLHQSDYSEKGIPVVMPKDLINGHISEESIARVDNSHVERLSKHKIEIGDILYSRRGDVGRCAFATEKEHGWLCGTGCLRVTINADKAEPQFVFYMLQMPDTVGWVINHAVGSTMLNLNTSILSNIPLSIPELAEQKKIVSILSAYDDLIENNQKQIKLLEEAAQRLYKEWFVDLHFPGYENVKIVDSVPEGWRKEKLVDIADIKAGGDKPEVCSNSKTKDNCIPVYANGIENDGLYGYTNKPVITHESVTISARGTVGFVFLRRTPYVPIVRLLSVIPFELSAVYLYYCLNNERFERNGTSQQQITVPMVKNKTILVADKETIGAFVLKVTIFLNKIDALKKQCELLTEARDRQLPKLMSGELEV